MIIERYSDGTPHLTDELIDALAERFIDQDVHGWGVTFEDYLRWPEAYDFVVGQHGNSLLELARQIGAHRRVIVRLLMRVHERPLANPAPRNIQDLRALEREMEAGLEHLPRRNGAIVEPLHHSSHPRSAAAKFRPREEQLL